MKSSFYIHYKISGDQRVNMKLSYRDDLVPCYSHDQENWFCTLDLSGQEQIRYSYEIHGNEGTLTEDGGYRSLVLDPTKTFHIKDQWRARNDQNRIFLRSAFSNVILKRTISLKKKSVAIKKPNIFIALHAGNVPKQYILGISGNIDALGKWDVAIPMEEVQPSFWKFELQLPEVDVHLEYKYSLIDPATKKIIVWEEGNNREVRHLFNAAKKEALHIQDESLRINPSWWRGAGLAIPVFSLRTKQGFGIGEFNDLKPLIDFSKSSGMCLVQVLPINDTLANMTWRDSYPYAAISVMALHPLYINVESIASFINTEDKQKYDKQREALNALETVDFEAVLNHKMTWLRLLYSTQKEELFQEEDFKKYFSLNSSWLIPYAAFCHLRDAHKSCRFDEWTEYSVYDEKDVIALADLEKESVGFWYFVQYHADKQLKAVKQYARDNGIVLKGDLPIGIYRYSVDAWTDPHLFHMEEQAGAPPDDYAVLGQNWGFPTYNWPEMAKDGYAWWRARFSNLEGYFDALRIDHILGFFRIWQIPGHCIQGTLGLFSPRLPYSMDELRGYGLTEDIKRYTVPFIRKYFLHELFGADTQYVIDTYLKEVFEESYIFKPIADSQIKIEHLFDSPEYASKAHLKSGLMQLHTEVLLLQEKNSDQFNPRISLNSTYSYRALDDHNRRAIDSLYHHYYFERHNEFWKSQALQKLPALLDASNMLICGEDLGMIPATVPEVMQQLNIMPLEIQRMPKGAKHFGSPNLYNYFSVCSPSCHDMSTIRGWFEENYETAKAFYHNHLNHRDVTPTTCTTQIVTEVVTEHLNAPSILAIFPIQDLLGMNEKLRREDVKAEQINVPANPKHYWKYRLHLDLDELNNAKEFIHTLREMVLSSKRQIPS